ncbi:MAG TPA: hypothetical protein VF618_08480 [Thermoanaerobaculia bacterium]
MNDFTDPIRERAAGLGTALIEGGPEALLEEVENLIPEPVKQQVQAFPVLAVLAGVGIGVWLGMKKGDELIAAGSAILTSTAAASLTDAFENVKR